MCRLSITILFLSCFVLINAILRLCCINHGISYCIPKIQVIVDTYVHMYIMSSVVWKRTCDVVPITMQRTVSLGVINPMQGDYNVNRKLRLSIATQCYALKIRRQGLSCCHGKGVQNSYNHFLIFWHNTITQPQLCLVIILCFACSPWQWIIITTYVVL